MPSSVSFTLKDSGGNTVAGSVSFNSADTIATFTPSSALAQNTTYTATVSGAQTSSGADDEQPVLVDLHHRGVPVPVQHLAEYGARRRWPLRATRVPANLGVQFTPSVNGWIAGIRFYKGTCNTGTHTGELWTASGTLLGQVTFTSESASGWQEADFSSPIAVTAGTTYVASYFTPNGNYSYTAGGFYQRRSHERAADGAAVLSRHPRQRPVQLRRRPVVPQQHLQREQLLGRRSVHDGGGCLRADGDRRSTPGLWVVR